MVPKYCKHKAVYAQNNKKLSNYNIDTYYVQCIWNTRIYKKNFIKILS